MLAMTMVHLVCIIFAHGLPDVLVYLVTCGFFRWWDVVMDHMISPYACLFLY